MIVCSCNVIKRREIEDAILDLLVVNPWRLITPGLVYREMAARGKCCGCFPNVVDIILEVTEAFHSRRETPGNDFHAYMDRLRTVHKVPRNARTLRRAISA